jgi:hypothetical protein
MQRFRMKMFSTNGSLFKEATIELSTVEMPRFSGLEMEYAYESCLFSPGESEVLDRYQSRSEAIAGHIALAKKFNLPYDI